jgi:hypothetical protein
MCPGATDELSGAGDGQRSEGLQDRERRRADLFNRRSHDKVVANAGEITNLA